VAVSSTHIIADILREEASLGDLVTLLRFKGGKVALVETEVEASSQIKGARVGELDLPEDSVLVAIVRKDEEEVIFPRGDTVINEGDKIFALTSVQKERKLAQILGATKE
jgi:trk system potassium uptake protein TrkA